MPIEGTPERFTVSVILWGGEKAGQDPVGHVALAVHRTTSQPAVCHLHHARCPDQVRFIYESRPAQPFDADPAPRGRCNLRTDLSAPEAERANAVLSGFGADATQLPYYGEGNCHNWAAGATGALERAGLAVPGDGERWAGLIGKGPLAMETSWRGDAGREWVACEKFRQAGPEVVDARWSDGDGRTSGTTETGAAAQKFRDRVGNLEKLLSRDR
ncbi:hypothetical protein F4778DRAFT_246071 [Xylariomycetidae sp. FL2044]|nr:hypothetical protein F4778DRAFT_246071 [Xylariomycetidae sp. FL2044]